ncbi:hypothetical protein [Halomicrobium sp. LC1Hm]|uniref:hypothetical protein n=1 Tax=Halomicrobium sp. LC1Hm TaxID=2610902 RepID=UPI0012982A15|nr:hypothetical protein [Halomicrobium sp. LC1Hm]QGA82943.1 putative membrane protein [Halomicrobium sp. LC1Hm]
MVSRESKIHAVVSVVGLAVLAAGAALFDVSIWWHQATVIGAFYAVIFGGTHAYFVVRGGGGDVPLTARKRFLLVLGGLVVLLPLAVVAGEWTVGPIPIRPVLTAVILGVLVWYLIAEGRAGYRATMAET